MEIKLKLDEVDKSMVLMYVNSYLLGAAHIDCFADLNIEETDLNEEISLSELFHDVGIASVTTKLSITDAQKCIYNLHN